MKQYTSEKKLFCSVYKSSKKNEMYLYVDRKNGIDGLPDTLKGIFGEPTHVLDLILTPEKKLARVDAAKVLSEIALNGFYLQMPPVVGEEKIGDYQVQQDSLNG